MNINRIRALKIFAADLLFTLVYFLFFYGRWNTLGRFASDTVPPHIYEFVYFGDILNWFLALIIITYALAEFCPFFRLIGEEKQILLKELKKAGKPIRKNQLVKAVKGLPTSSGYRLIDSLIFEKLIRKEQNGKISLEDNVKDHL